MDLLFSTLRSFLWLSPRQDVEGGDVYFYENLLVAGLGGVVKVSGLGGRLDPVSCEVAVAECGVCLPSVGIRVDQELPVPLGCTIHDACPLWLR
eukprot:5867788-Pyramimonas_sp.AAC.1